MGGNHGSQCNEQNGPAPHRDFGALTRMSNAHKDRLATIGVKRSQHSENLLLILLNTANVRVMVSHKAKRLTVCRFKAINGPNQ
jgi:hypothetical protein